VSDGGGWQPLSPSWRRPTDGVVRLAVIGGSTPFASRLFSAMADVVGAGSAAADVVWDLRLMGRNEEALTIVAEHARALLGHPHRVCGTTDVSRAFDGCDVVIVQPRVGGLAQRALDEDLGAAADGPADEGLGPGGARAAIRLAPVLRGLSADLQARCAGAFVISFSNPLSVAVSVLHAAGTPSVGICELPLVTAHEIADKLGVSRQRLSWQYTGLSHRGFIHDVEVEGESQLEDLIARLRFDGTTIGGIDADVIESLRAVPLKYHAMLSGTSRPASGRARALQSIRNDALQELVRDPATPPAVLAQRSMPWYHEAVLPVLAAVLGRPVPQRPTHVLDLMCDDLTVHEVLAEIDPGGVSPRVSGGPGDVEAQRWLECFYAHERLTTAFLAAPSIDGLTAMLQADPATPEHAVDMVVAALAADVAQLAARPVAQNWLRA
jgi:6-phospho-beta-glucosidase